MNVFADDATAKALLRGGKPGGAPEGAQYVGCFR